MKKVIVASKNPVKINSAQLAFQKMFPNDEFECTGLSVASGVPDQPIGDEETLQGAINRAERASQEISNADFWVGMEGGIQKRRDEMEVFAWMVVKSRDGMLGKGRTGTFFLPKPIIELINQGIELSVADDQVFGRNNSGKKNGATGLLTGDVIDRTEYYIHAMVLALIPFKNPNLY
ncbi:MAG TPA: inosine/xanthosine triphosphatase [Candidatus Magasanikbacteria bacterium]|nr:inosine/xanthosine triphosphatase [Candidatus Magasanikbacteria bacterium]